MLRGPSRFLFPVGLSGSRQLQITDRSVWDAPNSPSLLTPPPPLQQLRAISTTERIVGGRATNSNNTGAKIQLQKTTLLRLEKLIRQSLSAGDGQRTDDNTYSADRSQHSLTTDRLKAHWPLRALRRCCLTESPGSQSELKRAAISSPVAPGVPCQPDQPLRTMTPQPQSFGCLYDKTVKCFLLAE
uniref:Uncharacterized protein n=1 Tax=Knipowitschia caucasica TaxID=637954 RepID=A0AAV2K0C9_KNICA